MCYLSVKPNLTAQASWTKVALQYLLCLLTLREKANLSAACYTSVKAKLCEKFQFTIQAFFHTLKRLSPAKTEVKR